jgi:hypothetical protein
VKAWKKILVQVACSGLFSFGILLVLPVAAQEATTAQKGDYPNHEATNAGQKPVAEVAGKITELPDSPSATLQQSSANMPRGQAGDNPWLIAQSSSPAQSPQEQSQQPPQAQAGTSQSSSKQQPVGTAAAEAPMTTGIAASQPAGLAIAPAKQRRVRTIILRTGAIIGAGVAVGSVIALTEATSSKPPGAH